MPRRTQKTVESEPTREAPLASANGWAAAQVWPSLESITLKCPRPRGGSGGYHWWYLDMDEEKTDADGFSKLEHVPIVCGSCGLKLKLSADAPEYPAV